MFFYNRIKGETEDDLNAYGFCAISYFQPSLLLGDRTEHRTGEALASKWLPSLSPLLVGGLARYRPIHAETVARAMVARGEEIAAGDKWFRFKGMQRLASEVAGH